MQFNTNNNIIMHGCYNKLLNIHIGLYVFITCFSFPRYSVALVK